MAFPINDWVRKVLQYVVSSNVVNRRTEGGKLYEQSDNSIKFIEKPTCELRPAFAAIISSGFEQIDFCTAMQVVGHATAARIRARASGPDTSSEGSASACESRCAAKAIHFASLALSESRLVITWLNKVALSDELSMRTC